MPIGPTRASSSSRSSADALLVQGGSDPKLPADGGVDNSTREVHVGFRTKVDLWRLAAGLETATPRPLNAQDFDPGAPADVEGTRYTQGGTTVVEVLDPGLGHEWPGWNVMAIAIELFGR